MELEAGSASASARSFAQNIHSQWSLALNPFLRGRGSLASDRSRVNLKLSHASASRYSNAQLDDYHHLPQRRFPWSPPLRLQVTARFSHNSHTLRGTAGFGFWNDPFLMTGSRAPALPRAVWFFFGSQPSDMKLDHRTPGWGWKAATIDATRPSAIAWAPLAPLFVPLMNIPLFYRHLWPFVQRSLRIREALLSFDMADWHDYRLDWSCLRCQFFVDDHLVLEAPSPRGPMGFVLWLDNQYMIVKPWGRFAWGLLDVSETQWMEVRQLSIDSLKTLARKTTSAAQHQ
jgi:hypothetical protein